MNKTILTLFIRSLNVDSSYRYLQYFGYNISLNEIKIVLPYLKENVDKLDRTNKKLLLDNLPQNISNICKHELSRLFDQFI